MSITYQQAKRIRNTGLMSLFADQLIYEKSVGSAIKKTISLKTRGTIKGITEKFDPLNIVKKLTFGSSWAPALMGRLMGRDAKDIQYFSGRFKPIREGGTGDKLTKLSSKNYGNDNMSTVLQKIYKLLASTHEDNIKRMEMLNNRDEEKKMEDERRHKELLEALGGGSKGKLGKLTNIGKNMLDMLLPLIKKMIEQSVKLALKAFEWLKDFGKWMMKSGGWKKVFGAIGRLSPLLGFFAPIAIGGAVLAGAVTAVEAIGQNQIDRAKNLLERNANRESLSEEEKKKLDEEIKAAGGIIKLENIVNPKPLSESAVPPMPDPTKGLAGKNKAERWKELYGETHNQDGTPKLMIDTSVNDAEMKKLTRQSESKMSMPIDNKLDRTQDEVLRNRVVYGTMQRASSSHVNSTNVNQQVDKTTPIKRPVPSVRNQEPTIQELMFNNTRLVTQ